MATPKQTIGAKQIHEEAAAWVVRLEDEQVSQNEIKDFREWMSLSPRHRKVFNELSKLSRNFDHLGVLLQETELEFPAALQQVKPLTPNRSYIKSRFTALRAIATAALVIITVLGGLYLYPKEQQFIAQKGQRPLISLADGSKVHLNSNSKIQVNYKRGERQVNLVYGEATFSVAKDPDRPFTVIAGAGSTTALGTEFNIRNRGTDITVTVLSGTVLVKPGTVEQALSTDIPQAKNSSGKLLKTGQQISYNQQLGKVRALPDKALTRTASWRDGKLFFDDEALENVIIEISHYTTKNIVIADGSLQSLRVGGVFKIDNIDSFLEMLETALPIKAVDVSAELIMLIERKNISSNTDS